MTGKITRRDFLKVTGLGVVAAAVTTGCGPQARHVVREPYVKMPEYTYNGQSTYYATTCRECPAGCGTVVRTMQGRALKIEGNPRNPVNLGKTCARGQIALQGLYNPDRNQNPVHQSERGSGNFALVSWEEAVGVVADALTAHQPDEIAFLLGLKSDHLFDLVTEITQAIGAPSPLHFGAQEIFEARATLVNAAQLQFNEPTVPFFDLANADVTFSFGANFLETYLSPVAYARGFAQMRKGHAIKRGYLVQFEPRLSQTGTVADEWIPILPGSEGQVAMALGRLVAEARQITIPPAFEGVDVQAVAKTSGVSAATLERLASIFAEADHPLAIPGGSALGQSNGLETAQAILLVNVLLDNLGKSGGVFLTPGLPVYADVNPLSNTLNEVKDLIERMRSGKVKVLIVHGTNPVFELPVGLDFAGALAKVPQVISFASFPDETAGQSDYIFPDHTPLESWGYMKVATGGDRPVISGSQPVVVPYYNTRATADVLLGAIQSVGGDLATAVPYKDEVAFLQHALLNLVLEKGYFEAPEIRTFMASFQQYGGWWNADAGLTSPTATSALQANFSVPPPEFEGDGDYYLFPYMSVVFGDGSGVNRPWQQEVPDPMTTVMWNSWVEINPATADELGIEDDDLIRITSAYGSVEASVYRYPAIRPDTIAVPFGQGHTAFGRYAKDRGFNTAQLFGSKVNGAGDLAFAATKVKIEKTGRKRSLARFEGKLGVYPTQSQ